MGRLALHEMLQPIDPSVRPRAYFHERMFPRLSQRLGARILDRLDVLVQLSTLGEYGLEHGARARGAARRRGDCAPARWATEERCTSSGAAQVPTS